MAQRACFREETLHSRPTGRPRGHGCTFASPGTAGSGAAPPCPSGFGSVRGSVLPTSHRLCRTLRKLRSSFAQGLGRGRVASAFQTPSLGCREPLGSSPGWEGEASSRSPKPGPRFPSAPNAHEGGEVRAGRGTQAAATSITDTARKPHPCGRGGSIRSSPG